MDGEIEELCAASSEASSSDQFRIQIEEKYKDQQTFLLRGLKRAIMEYEFHQRQEDTPRYQVYDKRYKRSADWDLREEFH